MNTPQRLVDMILRGKNSQFNTVLSEELRERSSVLMEKLYREETKNLLEQVAQVLPVSVTPVTEEVQQPEAFFVESRYQLKDGNVGLLAESDRKLVSELYKTLNNENKERMSKLLSESQETFNRVLNLARLENKKGTKNG
jgi:hypothetical protein